MASTEDYIKRVQLELDDLTKKIRNHINELENPKAQALFETSAEVLIGLSTAFKHYQKGEEKAWK